MDLNQLLRDAVNRGATDIHLSAGVPPALRIRGRLIRLDGPVPSADEMGQLAGEMLPAPQHRELAERGEVDYSFGLSGVGRFRVNIFRQRGSLAVALRVIPMEVPTLAGLGLPDVVAGLARRRQGLVLVTGPTGSGKSTTLAAMIDLINSEQDLHIITLEDPIEYLHHHKRCVVHQREIGTDTRGFARGLRAALREDPDVILVGEMRDRETIEIALQAAETGHLVFATLHTPDAPGTVDRIISVFPGEMQPQIRVQLAGVLQGVLAQRLFPRAGGLGLVAAVEIMLGTTAVRNLIREAKSHQLANVIQTSQSIGMRTMEQAVADLFRQGLIDATEYQQFQAERQRNPAENPYAR